MPEISSTSHNSQISYQGWECPRCKQINAPWVQHCNCQGNIFPQVTTSTCIINGDQSDYALPRSHSIEIKTNPDTFHVGGSDYWNPQTRRYENIPGSISNNIGRVTCTYLDNKFKSEE